MIYGLPKTVEVGGREYDIRTDFRVIMEIFEAMNDPELSDRDRGYVCLVIFYTDFDTMPQDDYDEAVQKMTWFLNGGSNEPEKAGKGKLMDWEQDYNLIIPPVNRIAGKEVRELEYLHWWTFLGYYQEIGDCTFAQVVRIRSLKAKGKKLDKSDQEFYKNNRDLVELKKRYTDTDQAVLSAWGAL